MRWPFRKSSPTWKQMWERADCHIQDLAEEMSAMRKKNYALSNQICELQVAINKLKREDVPFVPGYPK